MPRARATPRTAGLRTIIPELALGGDEDRWPVRSIEAKAGGLGRSVAGKSHILHRLLAGFPGHWNRPERGRGRPRLRSDLPDGPERVGHHIEPTVVHHELDRP